MEIFLTEKKIKTNRNERNIRIPFTCLRKRVLEEAHCAVRLALSAFRFVFIRLTVVSPFFTHFSPSEDSERLFTQSQLPRIAFK